MISFRTFRKVCTATKSSWAISIEILIGIAACLASLLLFIWFTREIVERDTLAIDRSISLLVYGWRTPFLTQVMLIVSAFGNQLLLVFAALVAIIFSLHKHKKEAILFCIAIAMGGILDLSLKMMVQRARPAIAPLVIEHSYSFPSGHSMDAFIFYALMAYFSYHYLHDRRFTIIVTALSATLILLIGFSRIYLGVHYFTDVIAGYLAGFGWFISILLVEHTLIFYKLFRKTN